MEDMRHDGSKRHYNSAPPEVIWFEGGQILSFEIPTSGRNSLIGYQRDLHRELTNRYPQTQLNPRPVTKETCYEHIVWNACNRQ